MKHRVQITFSLKHDHCYDREPIASFIAPVGIWSRSPATLTRIFKEKGMHPAYFGIWQAGDIDWRTPRLPRTPLYRTVVALLDGEWYHPGCYIVEYGNPVPLAGDKTFDEMFQLLSRVVARCVELMPPKPVSVETPNRCKRVL